VRIAERATWNVRLGSWLCENAKTRGGDRRSYSSKTALAVKRANELNLTNEPKNVTLAAFQSFAFLHSQGSKSDLADPSGVSPLYPRNLSSRRSPRMSATGQKTSQTASGPGRQEYDRAHGQYSAMSGISRSARPTLFDLRQGSGICNKGLGRPQMA
jgi:hypothetical protein